jgi:GNAT superfamily N-acetyltransferase
VSRITDFAMQRSEYRLRCLRVYGERSVRDVKGGWRIMSVEQFTAAAAEGAEAEFMYRFVAMAPPAVSERLGIAVDRIGGGVALSVRNDVTGYFSKALGFGFAEPVTAGLVERVLAFYTQHGSAGMTLQIAPEVLPSNWKDICARYDLRAAGPWWKLACAMQDATPQPGDLRAGPVKPNQIDEWIRVLLEGFGMPESLADMMTGGIDGGLVPFAAWDGDEMVAAADLYVHHDVGSLNATATLPTHRNKGAQTALISARVKAAAEAGCRWLVAETGVAEDGATNPSLSNLKRAGLQPRYVRQNWVWRTPGGRS